LPELVADTAGHDQQHQRGRDDDQQPAVPSALLLLPSQLGLPRRARPAAAHRVRLMSDSCCRSANSSSSVGRSKLNRLRGRQTSQPAASSRPIARTASSPYCSCPRATSPPPPKQPQSTL